MATWPWKKKTKTPPVPVPAPRIEQETEVLEQVHRPLAPEVPEPVPVSAPRIEQEARFDPTRVIAAVVTAASTVFTAWSVWDLVATSVEPTPVLLHVVGLVLGLGVEAVWLWMLAIEWSQAGRSGRVGRGLTLTGWVLAIGAAAVLVLHGAITAWPMVVLAALPLAAKAGWHWLTTIRAEETRARLEALGAQERESAEAQRRQAEEAAADDASLTPEQRREIADIRRGTQYTRLKADAQAEQAEAEIEAANRVRMAEDRATAERLQARYELAGQIAGRLPIEILAQVMPGLGEEVTAKEVPHRALDRSRTDPAPAASGALAPAAKTTAPAGFGAAFATAQARTPGTSAEQQMPEVHPSSLEAQRNRERVSQAYAALVEEGQTPSIGAVARRAGLSERTARRHMEALNLI